MLLDDAIAFQRNPCAALVREGDIRASLPAVSGWIVGVELQAGTPRLP